MDGCAAYYKNTRKEIKYYLPKHYTRVLEIGCGVGNFRANLNQECEYLGIEPQEEAVREAHQNGVAVLQGTFDDVAHYLADGYYDLVICNDVLEHMMYPENFLNEIKRIMTHHGVVVGSIPNIRHLRALKHILWHRDWHYQQSGIFDRTHLRFFTMKSFARMVVAQGYTIEVTNKSAGYPTNRFHKTCFIGEKIIIM